MSQAIQSLVSGQSFRDREGQRWRVCGPRPGQADQFVVEAQLKGSYPRVAVYAMTEREFREHARSEELKPEHVVRGGRNTEKH